MDTSLTLIPQHDQILRELERLMKHEFFGAPLGSFNDYSPMNRPNYTYHRISSKSIIRLMTLHPGSGQEILRASLRYTSLSQSGAYEALSYAWGSPEMPCRICIDNRILQITESLHTALLRLRRPAGKRVLWVDAVCINQADNEEKSLQVAIMHKIFSSASRVLCWLGEDEDRDGFNTVQLLRKLGETSFSDIPGSSITPSQLRSKNLPGQGDSAWYAARRFFERPWFCRGWVIQEVVLARDPTLLCGGLEVIWGELVHGVELLLEYSLISRCTSVTLGPTNEGLSCLRTMLQLRSSSTLTGMYAEMIRSFTIRGEDAQRELHEGSERNIPGLIESVGISRALHGSSGTLFDRDGAFETIMGSCLELLGMDRETTLPRPPLYGLLQAFMFSSTTDPRDIYFALLNISSDKDEPDLRPDYTESVEATLLRFARFFVLRPALENVRPYPRLLDAGIAFRPPAATAGPPHPASTLPSWAPLRHDPDQSQHVLGFVTPGRLNLGYHASGEESTTTTTTNFRACEDGDDRAIVGTGGRVDVISRLVAQPEWSAEAAESRAFFQEIDRMILHREKPYPHLGEGETMLDVQWRTLIGGADWRSQMADDRYRDWYLTGRRKIEEGAVTEVLMRVATESADAPIVDWDELLGEWAKKWWALAPHLMVCETVGGLVGLVPVGAEVGDFVCVFKGESMPTLLRPVGADARRYQVIGACYLHGIMQGEFLQSDAWKEEEICLV